MKKHVIFAFLILILSTFICCESDIEQTYQGNLKSTQTENLIKDLEEICVKIENNTINFETETDFQKCINLFVNNDYSKLADFENIYGIKSFRNQYKYKFAKCPVDDPIFSSMLNENGQIIIEGYYFTLDFNKKEIVVNNSKMLNERTMVFSFEDDVFSILKNENRLKSATSEYCGQENLIHSFSGGVFTSVDHNKYGIYNSLVSKIWVNQDFINYLGQRTVNTPFVIQGEDQSISEYDINMVVPNGINSRCFFKRDSYQNEIIYDKNNVHNNELKVTPYANTRRLVGFRLDIEYTWQFVPGGFFAYDRARIQCHQY